MGRVWRLDWGESHRFTESGQEPGLSATETAIIRMGLQSIAPGPHYLHLTGLTAAGPPSASDPVRRRCGLDRADY